MCILFKTLYRHHIEYLYNTFIITYLVVLTSEGQYKHMNQFRRCKMLVKLHCKTDYTVPTASSGSLYSFWAWDRLTQQKHIASPYILWVTVLLPNPMMKQYELHNFMLAVMGTALIILLTFLAVDKLVG